MAQKNLFRDILRLITPEEVALLTDSVMGRQKVMLKLIVLEDLGLVVPQVITEEPEAAVTQSDVIVAEDNLAKIIPFKKMSEEKLEPSAVEELSAQIEVAQTAEAIPAPTPTEEEKNKESFDENYVEINEDGSVKFKEDEVVFEEKVDLTEFILTQQEKCKEASHGMKKKEVMELYSKNSTVDLSRERAQRSNPSRKHNDGILINRKQS
jgi:hypothetical protein